MVTVTMTRDEFTAKAAALKEATGLTISTDEGDVSKDGVDVHYKFSGATLALTVVKKPMILTVGFCERKILGWLGVK